MNYNQNSGYGRALLDMVHGIVPVFGRVFIVCDPDDSADPNFQKLQEVCSTDSTGVLRFYTSLKEAYDATTTNNNDVILLDAHSAHVLTTGLTVSKSRVHFIGMDGGERLQAQGARVQTTDAAAVAYVIRNTGTRNSFRNIKFTMNDTNAAAIHCFEEGGEGTLFKNCSFIFSVVDNLDLTTASEFVCGSDSATYIDCTFGAATLTTTASGGRTVCLYDAVTGGATTPRDNVFRNCIFTIESSDAGSLFVSMAASGDAKGINNFDNCTFIASLVSGGGIALTKAVSTANGLTDGIFCYGYPRAYNVANFGTNGTNNDNLYVIGTVVDPSAATDFIAVKPVAT